MTLHAARDGQTVTVSASSGSVQVTVTEDLSHLRSFWAGLGVLLKEADAEADQPVHEPAEGGF